MSMLEQILAEQPAFHKAETEIKREFSTSESYLDHREAEKLIRSASACHGILKDVARFIFDQIDHDSKTLEIGAGISTLVFGLKLSKHTAITPNATEIAAIKEYATDKRIDIENITFVAEESNVFLPQCDIHGLDFVLIDGKHAFPWPIIDWFYTADRLKKGGLMMIDDTQMYPVAILRSFMNEDPRWKLNKVFENRTAVFQKTSESIHDVAWHMQPYVVKRNRLGLKGSGKKFLRRVLGIS